MSETGEYTIRPYKGFRDGDRGEPCVHPAFSGRFLGNDHLPVYRIDAFYLIKFFGDFI
jgi:hypothetical protein